MKNLLKSLFLCLFMIIVFTHVYSETNNSIGSPVMVGYYIDFKDHPMKFRNIKSNEIEKMILEDILIYKKGGNFSVYHLSGVWFALTLNYFLYPEEYQSRKHNSILKEYFLLRDKISYYNLIDDVDIWLDNIYLNNLKHVEKTLPLELYKLSRKEEITDTAVEKIMKEYEFYDIDIEYYLLKNINSYPRLDNNFENMLKIIDKIHERSFRDNGQIKYYGGINKVHYFLLLIMGNNRKYMDSFIERETKYDSFLFPNKERAINILKFIDYCDAWIKDESYKKYLKNKIRYVIKHKESCDKLENNLSKCYHGDKKVPSEPLYHIE